MLTDDQHAQAPVVLFPLPTEEPRAACHVQPATSSSPLSRCPGRGASGLQSAGWAQRAPRCSWARLPLSPASIPATWAASPCATTGTTLALNFCHELLGPSLCACHLPRCLPAVTFLLGTASPWTDQESPRVPSARGSHRPRPTGLGFRGQGLSHPCPDTSQKDNAPTPFLCLLGFYLLLFLGGNLLNPVSKLRTLLM